MVLIKRHVEAMLRGNAAPDVGGSKLQGCYHEVLDPELGAPTQGLAESLVIVYFFPPRLKLIAKPVSS